MRKGIATVVAGLIFTAGCAAKTNNGLSAPASTWLSAEISAARTAATNGRYHEALTDLTAIEASVRTFRSQRAIDDDHAARILAAVARVRTALGRYETTTTATTAPPATVAPGPGPGNGKHGHNGKGGNEGD